MLLQFVYIVTVDYTSVPPRDLKIFIEKLAGFAGRVADVVKVAGLPLLQYTIRVVAPGVYCSLTPPRC